MCLESAICVERHFWLQFEFILPSLLRIPMVFSVVLTRCELNSETCLQGSHLLSRDRKSTQFIFLKSAFLAELTISCAFFGN